MKGLLAAIERYKKLELQLTGEVAGRQDEGTILLLDKTLSELHETIASTVPANGSEAVLQIRFFLDLASRRIGESLDMEIVKHLISTRLRPSPFENTECRISLIDTQFRYVTTTRGNREFYNLGERDIVGRHVADVIGDARFTGRARNFLERAFAGERTEYYHALETPDGLRTMKCVMEPRKAETKGAVVTMLDVTDELRGASSIGLVDIKKSAAA